MFSIFFALLTFLGWGSGDIFSAVASRRIGAFRTTFWITAITLPLLTLISPFFLPQLSGATTGIIILALGLGVLVTVGYMAFAEALRIGTPSLVGVISGSFGGLVVILSIIFLGEHLNSWQVMAIVAIIAGLTLTSLDFAELKKRSIKLDRSVALAFFAMVSWAIYFTFIKIPINHMGWFWPDFIAAISGTLFLLAFGLRRIKLTRSEARRGIPPVLGGALLANGGVLTYAIALQHGSASIVAPIAGAYPVLFVILASIIFKDPVTSVQRLGMVITLTGIVSLSLVSSS
jgi:drug/metabolite transporter (DMT)-like permease